MKIKKLCIALFIFGCLAQNAILSAQEKIENDILSSEIFSQLKENKRFHASFNEEKVILKYSPDTELCKRAVNSWTEEENPKFTSEDLFYFDKNGADVPIEKVSKIIRSISTMKGMSYYSNSRKKWETLYHKSNLIKSLNDKTPLPDDLEGSADGKSFYCEQEDNSLGKCVYKVDYAQSEKEISVCFTLKESLKLGPVTAVKPDNLKINYIIIDQGDYFIAYMFVQVKYPNISFLDNILNRSFNARVEAITDWFIKSF